MIVGIQEESDSDLWKVGVLFIIKSLSQYPLLDLPHIGLDLIITSQS